MNETTAPEVLTHITSLIPMKRVGRAEEVAELVAWLASEKGVLLDGRRVRHQRRTGDLLANILGSAHAVNRSNSRVGGGHQDVCTNV